MSVSININITDNCSDNTGTPVENPNSDTGTSVPGSGFPPDMMSHEVGPFPNEMIAGYLSHFIMAFEFLSGEMKGYVLPISSPPAIQTVAWGQPFIYRGSSANHRVKLPVPSESSLPNEITEQDFASRPEEYFEVGKETVWLQILNLDCRMETEFGPIRIILGETVKKEYPEVFQPSLGVAQALGKRGFPARLFFNPIAVVETPFGSFRATHGTLTYGRVTAFPPIGTPVTISEMVPLEDIDEVRELANKGALNEVVPITVARIIALSHPIDVGMQISGEEAFRAVEFNISNPRRRKQ